MRREQLLLSNGNLLVRRHLRRKHELLPAVHDRGENTSAMSDGVLHE